MHDEGKEEVDTFLTWQQKSGQKKKNVLVIWASHFQGLCCVNSTGKITLQKIISEKTMSPNLEI